MDEQEKDAFIVKDKRRFTEGAEDIKEESKKETGTNETTGAHAQAGSQTHEHTHEHEEEADAHPVEINFGTFIFSFARSAFFHLGEEPDPATGEKKVSLPFAKEIIDILAMLEEKTKGNLTQEEDQLLKSLLYALRMRYVEAAAKK